MSVSIVAPACAPARATAPSLGVPEAQAPARPDIISPAPLVASCVCETMDDGAVLCATSLVEGDPIADSPYALTDDPLPPWAFPPAFTVEIDGHRTSYR
ncbi:MAG: hypothetical protein AAF721_00590 [Myxococcota bacterium]